MAKMLMPILAVVSLSFAAIPFAGAPAVAGDTTMPAVASTDPPATTQPSNDDSGIISVDADTLYNAYQANEVRAVSIYKDRLVAVKGIVRKVALTKRENRPVVFLNGQGPIPEVGCVFNLGKDDPALDKMKALNVGDKVSIVGNVVDSVQGCVRIYALSIDDPDDSK